MTLKSYEDVNHLVLNCYRDGYSIAVKLNEFPVFTSETILETARISYEENSLLDYIENEELPPLLVEMIDSSPKLSQYKIWHNGCLILEVRDRIGHINSENSANSRSQSFAAKASQFLLNHSPHSPRWLLNNQDDPLDADTSAKLKDDESPYYDSFFIMLKPTNLSMLYDVLNLTDSNCWSSMDRLQLESQIVLHNSPSLSLEVEPTKAPTESSNTRRPKRKRLPHTRLKDLPNKSLASSTTTTANLNQSKFSYMRLDKNNSNNETSNHNRGNVVFHNNYTQELDSIGNATSCLPPQLALQHFIATKKATRKNVQTAIVQKYCRFKTKFDRS